MINYLKIFFLLSIVSIYACDPDEPEPVNEEELITTVRFTLSPSSGGSSVIISYKDLDGDGNGLPVVTSGLLATNTTYVGKLEFLNETKTPSENITTEIKDEGVDHQVFLRASTQELADAIRFSYQDFDINNKPIGTELNISTIGAAKGNMIITLRHKPNKSAAKVVDGDITNAGGETDVEVMIPVEIK